VTATIAFQLDADDRRGFLASRLIVYLDQNHWSTIANTITGARPVSSKDVAAVRLLGVLAEEGRIVLPLSAGHTARAVGFDLAEHRFDDPALAGVRLEPATDPAAAAGRRDRLVEPVRVGRAHRPYSLASLAIGCYRSPDLRNHLIPIPLRSSAIRPEPMSGIDTGV
jgi:hypothetical protein